MSIDLEGRVAIVTGAAQGLGAAYAKVLAAEGAKVCVSDLLDGHYRCMQALGLEGSISQDNEDCAGNHGAGEAEMG